MIVNLTSIITHDYSLKEKNIQNNKKTIICIIKPMDKALDGYYLKGKYDYFKCEN